ncbi:hypothetical protein O9992_22635 [Vibrio lentus]|nr:hypothetical protein [Vibrio lentus]
MVALDGDLDINESGRDGQLLSISENIFSNQALFGIHRARPFHHIDLSDFYVSFVRLERNRSLSNGTNRCAFVCHQVTPISLFKHCCKTLESCVT